MKLSVMKINGWLIFGVCICCSSPSPTPAPIFAAQVYYKTQGGADLLNPQTSGSFNKDGIKVFDVSINQSGVQVNTPSTVNTYGTSKCSSFVCQPDNNSALYSIQFVVRPTNELKEALIQLNSSVIDTLSYQIISASPQFGYAVNNVSYKGQVVWIRGMATPATITIIK